MTFYREETTEQKVFGYLCELQDKCYWHSWFIHYQFGTDDDGDPFVDAKIEDRDGGTVVEVIGAFDLFEAIEGLIEELERDRE